MGISPQFTQDFNSTQNDKDLTQTQKVQDFNSNKKSQFPDYVKPFLKQYICLLGINRDFGYLLKDLLYKNVKNGSLKKRETHIDRLCFYIKRYGEAVKSGFFKDLSEEELPKDVFRNIENIEWRLDNFMEIYFVPYIIIDDEYGDAYEDGYGYPCKFTLSKKKYEKGVDEDYPGLKKLVDTLGLYYETVKYEKIYFQPLLEENSYNSESEDESEENSYNTESEDESDDESEKRRLIEEMLRSDSDSDGDHVIDYDSDPISDFDSDYDGDE